MGSFVLAGLLLLAASLPAGSAFATGYAPPSLTAWQRSHEAHLTITWPETTRVQQKRIGDRLILRFAKPLAADTPSALRNLSNFIHLDRTTIQDGDLSLALRLGVFAKVTLPEKRMVTVEFSRGSARPASPRISASTIENGMRLTLDWPGPTAIKTHAAINRLVVDVDPAWDFDPVELAELQQTLKPWINEIRTEVEGDRTRLALILEPQISPSISSDGAMRTLVDLIRDARTLPAPAAGPAGPVFIPKARPASTVAGSGATRANPPIPRRRPVVDSVLFPDETSASKDAADPPDDPAKTPKAPVPQALVFAWDQPVAAAVFTRAGHLWAVFDHPESARLPALPRAPSAFGPGSEVPVDGGTALRFPLKGAIDIGVSRTVEGHWRIEPRASRPGVRPLDIHRADGSASLRVTPASGNRILRVIDPSVGDRIDVLPLADAGLGQPSRRRFVDLELLPTMQGLAWRPLNDRLLAEIDGSGLTFSSPGGLSLSAKAAEASPPKGQAIVEAVAGPDADHRKAAGKPVERPAMKTREADEARTPEPSPPRSYVGLAGSGVERSLVGEYRRIRRQAIPKAPPEERDRARLDLARLLVSERLATEARTVLNTISDDAAGDVVLQKRALRGVAAFLIGHVKEASDLLLSAELGEDEEIDLWRAALESMDSRWQTAADRWRATDAILDIYPPRLKVDLGLLAVEAAIETGDDKLLRKGIRRLASLPLNPYDQARVDAMEALKAERSGDLDRARALLTGLAESPNPAMRTRADFRLAALDLEASRDRPSVLAALDRRMPLWRGHPEERQMLDSLARRFKDAKALRKALTTWQRLIRLYPDAAKDAALTRLRQDTFMQALANENQPAIDLFDVYAIYLDFIDLLPQGSEAQEARRHLARHLTDLDLLDPAIEMLQSLMAATTEAVERARLASEIAMLMLRQDRPARALSMLESAERIGGAWPPALEETWRLTKARALAALDRGNDALRELRDLQSRPARRVRAEILWNERRWPGLAAAIEAYLEDTDETSRLTDDDQQLVLWLALARQREGRSGALDALRQRFGGVMLGGRHAEAFEVATQHQAPIGDIETFLAATDDQLAELRRFREVKEASP